MDYYILTTCFIATILLTQMTLFISFISPTSKKNRKADGPFDSDDLLGTVERAALHGHKHFLEWKKKNGYAPKRHVHIMTISSVAKFKKLSEIYAEFGTVVELYLMKFDSANNALDLIDLFDEPHLAQRKKTKVNAENNGVNAEDKEVETEDIEPKTDNNEVKIEDTEAKADDTEVKVEYQVVNTEDNVQTTEDIVAKIDNNEVKTSKNELKREDKNSDFLGKKRKEKSIGASKDFTPTKIILIPIENMFGHSFSSEVSEKVYDSIKHLILQ